MNQQPDKFFHDKLRGYQKSAPAHAWNRIAENMQNKRRGINWMRAAAAVALLAAAGILLYPRTRTDDTTTLITENKTSEQPTENSTQILTDTTPGSVRTEPDATRQPVVVVPNDMPVRSKSSAPRKQIAKQPQVTRDIQEPDSGELPPIAEANVTQATNIAAASEESVDGMKDNSSKNDTIIFTSEEVN